MNIFPEQGNVKINKGIKSYIIYPYSIVNYGARNLDGSIPTIKIGKYSSIGKNCTFVLCNHKYDCVTTSKPNVMLWEHGQGNNHCYTRGDIVIGNDVWIGVNVTLLDGITVGHGAIIGAGSVVTSDVEPYSIVAGNPAKSIKKRFTETQITRLLSSTWWDLSEETLSSLNLYTASVDDFLDRIDALQNTN